MRTETLKSTLKRNPCFERDWVRKGEVLAQYGAEAWAKLPRHGIHKQGRREFVSRECLQDSL